MTVHYTSMHVMCVCLCVQACASTCMLARVHVYARNICTHVNTYMHVHGDMCMYVSAHVHVHVCISVCACMSTGLLVCAAHTHAWYMCACACTPMCICICAYTICMYVRVKSVWWGVELALGSVAMDAVSPALASVSSGITLHLGWGWFSRVPHCSCSTFSSRPFSSARTAPHALASPVLRMLSPAGLEVWWWEVHFPGQPQAQVAQVPALWADVLSGFAPLGYKGNFLPLCGDRE